MLYQAYQLQSDLMSPLRMLAQSMSASFWLRDTERSPLRSVSAASDVLSRMRLTHTRPAYGINTVTVVGEQEVAVIEEVALKLPFGCSMLLFCR